MVYTLIQLSFDELVVIIKNKRGVLCAVKWDTGEVVAKQCTACEKWTFLDGFNKAKKGYAGKHSMCRPCHTKATKSLLEKYKAEADFNREVAEDVAFMRKQLDDAEAYVKGRTLY